MRQRAPLADSTIWEMEQRGQFPRRFLLTPLCVVWDLAEVEAWLAGPSRSAARLPRMSANGSHGPSKSGIEARTGRLRIRRLRRYFSFKSVI
ncbi:MAG TPA: AlpA family phage regulatory protein [Brevundimonas sp.]|nr:AlpA family phage regulatory protein [Brevundimonas sp.]